jgi:hypothetical protein
LSDTQGLRLNGARDHRLTTAVAARLAVMFDRRIRAVEDRREFDVIVARVLAGAPDEQCPPPAEGVAAPAVNWPFWLARYRQCLDALRERLGLPGDIYQAAGGDLVSAAGGRQLGRWPEY